MSTLENGNVRKVLLQNQENMESKLAEIAKYISGQFYYNCFCYWEGKRVKGEKIVFNFMKVVSSLFILFIICFSKCIVFLSSLLVLSTGHHRAMEMQLSKVFKAFYLKTNEF